MARALSFTCAALLVCFGGSAWANKPKIAVLGLEVVPGPNGVVDPAMTQLAKDITRDLRQRAQSGASRYTLAPNSSKELTDEKLLMSCDDEATTCMVAIGNGLAADVMLYGHLERKGDAFRISLKLLDVKARTVELGSEDMAAGATVASVSKKLYTRLLGDVPGATTGSLVVRARTPNGSAIMDGRVMVDEQLRGQLAGGTLTLSGLAEGTHTVAIETGGRHERFEERVTVRAGDPAIVDALLIDKDITATQRPRRSGLWKVSLGAGLVLAVAGGALAYYSWDQMTTSQSSIFLAGAEPGASVTSEDCGKSQETLLRETKVAADKLSYQAFQDTCSWHSRIYVGYGIGAVGTVGAIVSLIMLSRDPPASEQPATGPRGRRSNVAIMPVLAPDHAGAALSLRW